VIVDSECLQWEVTSLCAHDAAVKFSNPNYIEHHLSLHLNVGVGRAARAYDHSEWHVQQCPSPLQQLTTASPRVRAGGGGHITTLPAYTPLPTASPLASLVRANKGTPRAPQNWGTPRAPLTKITLGCPNSGVPKKVRAPALVSPKAKHCISSLTWPLWVCAAGGAGCGGGDGDGGGAG
jgi:hypothetical protein